MQTLNDINDRLGKVDIRLALMEQSQANAAAVWEGAEKRLFEVIGELKSTMLEKFNDLEHVLFVGNGKPSFDKRLTELEFTEAVRAGEIAKNERVWKRITPFIPWITAVLGAAAMFFIKNGAK